MEKKISLTILVLWLALSLLLWFGPRQEISEAERRPLAQMPALSVESLQTGRFMEDFDSFALDQFPLRDGFRRVKSLFHFYGMGQKDNNGIYLSQGHGVKMEYPLNETSLKHFLGRMNHLREKYFPENKVYFAVAPDKGYYLAEDSGHLALDYEKLYASLEEALPWAQHIDLRGTLSAEDYYRTDTHWRQEALAETANALRESLGLAPLLETDFTVTRVERPFYGVYYGQAALPMEPDTMYLLENDILSGCTVYDHETGKTTAVYDREKEDSRDLYDVFLSGAKPLLTVTNPNGDRERKLVVFRDSFGSSMIPLLADGYSEITLVDIRYIRSDLLDRFVTFENQDVLLLYSTLVINNSQTMQ